MLNVSLYVTWSPSCGARDVFCRLRFFVAEWDGVVRGLCVVTSLAVVMSCSMPSFQLAQALLMSRRAAGVRGMSVSGEGRGTVATC